MNQKNKKAIIFDMDGTLLHSEKLALFSYPETLKQLRKQDHSVPETITKEDVHYILGLTADEIFNYLLPNAAPEALQEAKSILSVVEKEHLPVKAHLFSNVRKILQTLKQQGYSLFVASNGGAAYVPHAANVHGISPYFEQIYCAGIQKTESKVDLVRLLLKEHQVSQGIMVGDKASDIEAGQKNNLTTVGCEFGFGSTIETKKADYAISEILALLPIIDNVFMKSV